MPVPRTKCIRTTVTEDEYARLARLADGQTLSDWVREVLHAAATPRPADHLLLAEVLALRTIVLNLHFAVATGDTPTPDAMNRLIERADQEKIRKAQERLESASVRMAR
jgi:hypothetical protein